MSTRTRAEEARRIVGRLRESLQDLGGCEVSTIYLRQPTIAATGTGVRLQVSIEIVLDAPDEAAP